MTRASTPASVSCGPYPRGRCAWCAVRTWSAGGPRRRLTGRSVAVGDPWVVWAVCTALVAVLMVVVTRGR